MPTLDAHPGQCLGWDLRAEARRARRKPAHGGMAMDKWECPCGYIYDPEEGDAETNIAMGTPFEDLPDDWVCPKCGAEKEFFEKLD